MQLQDFELQALKTGFALEHAVSECLRKSGWVVISNKYYVDDTEETVREIDLIAYKSRLVESFRVYTVLIISCKKSESNVWAMFTRSLDASDPNRNWTPFHAWSNSPVAKYFLSAASFPKEYHTLGNQLSALRKPSTDIFAFQEMNKQSGAPQNDRAIFQSITSLMKAQAYELKALPDRKKDPCIYQFSLLTVLDARLINIQFGSGGPDAMECCDEMYLANYIIHKQEGCSRIRIVRSDFFEISLADYEALHEFNCKVFGEQERNFYLNVMEDQKRVDVFIQQFKEAVRNRLRWRLHDYSKKVPDLKSMELVWNKEKGYVSVDLPVSDGEIAFLNGDTTARRLVAEALKGIYRYSGDFQFEQEIPF